MDKNFWDLRPDENTEKAYREEKANTMARAITSSMLKWARKPADLYPTPADCTYSLLPHIAHLLPGNAFVLEPACADGAMIGPLEEYGYRVDGYDLRTDVTGGQGGYNFLDRNQYFDHVGEYDACMTNPPFGIAAEFIRRAIEEAPVAVMLLKSNYWHTIGRKALFRETRPLLQLNLTWRPAFLQEERGNSPLMDCMWVVWVRGHQGSCSVEMVDRLKTCPFNTGGKDIGDL